MKQSISIAICDSLIEQQTDTGTCPEAHAITVPSPVLADAALTVDEKQGSAAALVAQEDHLSSGKRPGGKKLSVRGRKRKEPQTVEERREKEREKKARWRAKKREKDTLSHHFSMSHHDMPIEIWEAIQNHLKIYSSGSPEDESQSIVTLLNTIGYAWQGTALIRAPGKVKSTLGCATVPSAQSCGAQILDDHRPSLQMVANNSTPTERETVMTTAKHLKHSPQKAQVKQKQSTVIMNNSHRTMSIEKKTPDLTPPDK